MHLCLQDSVERLSRHGSAHGTPVRGQTLPAQHPLSRQVAIAEAAWQLHGASSPQPGIHYPKSANASESASPAASNNPPERLSPDHNGSTMHPPEGLRRGSDGSQSLAGNDGDPAARLDMKQTAETPEQGPAHSAVHVTPVQTGKAAASEHEELNEGCVDNLLQELHQQTAECIALSRGSAEEASQKPPSSPLVVRALDFREGASSGVEAADVHCAQCCKLKARIVQLEAQVDTSRLPPLSCDCYALPHPGSESCHGRQLILIFA